MKALVLTPSADFREPFDWAFDAQAKALEGTGFEVLARRWNEAGDVAGFDVVLPLTAWGYQFRLESWHDLLDRLETEARCTLNPVSVLRWNTDKRYLDDVADAGVPTIPTMLLDPFDEDGLARAFATFGPQIVVKPPGSAGAFDTFRLTAADPFPETVRGRRMLAQPFLRSVQEEGEYSLLFFGGDFSHALVKRPKAGDYRVQPHLGGRETLCEPPDDAVSLAEAALGVVPAHCTYARVDILRDDDGELRIIELELIEPALWLDRASGAATRFASAVVSALR
jgi:glutathione synthase/RimK-type ligase-like ATP-grasp enzyme